MFVSVMQGVKLSPAAKSFVPETFTLSAQKSLVTHCGLWDMSQMPHYMTTCYPFFDNDCAHNLQ